MLHLRLRLHLHLPPCVPHESCGTIRDNLDPEQTGAGQMLLAQTLLGSERPVTVIATGPLTNLAWALDNYPEVSSKIDKVLIMGASPSLLSRFPLLSMFFKSLYTNLRHRPNCYTVS